jgi:hypothetical protein
VTAQLVLVGDKRHGTVGGYTNYHCRCAECTRAAMAAAARRQQLPCRECGEPCWAGTKSPTVIRSGRVTAEALTLADAARMMREAVKDRSYVDHTGLGQSVDGFLAYFRTERGKTDETCRSYEYCLAAFAIHYADLSLEDFDGKHGTNLIRDFLRAKYAEVQGNTWNTRLATVKALFKWAFEEGRIDHNPAAMLRYRTVPESERQAHAPSVIEKIVRAQDERRDRIGVQLLGRMALRRNELRVFQFRHLDVDTQVLTVYGKGGTVRPGLGVRRPVRADPAGTVRTARRAGRVPPLPAEARPRRQVPGHPARRDLGRPPLTVESERRRQVVDALPETRRRDAFPEARDAPLGRHELLARDPRPAVDAEVHAAQVDQVDDEVYARRRLGYG